MDGWITIGTELDTKSFDKQIKSLERQLNDYVSDLEAMSKEEGFNEQSQEVLELQKNIEILTNKIGNLRQKQAELNKRGMPNISQMTNDIANKTENVIKKVAKWGLAIFSVRSAYMFVRQAVSTLSQYNEKIGTDIEYIKYALASSLQPIIERIIQLAYKLLAYINYISQAWFGVNIFANASAKAFNNVKKGLSGANKQAKELQKTLLGFDEMNILQDGSTTKGGGGGGIGLPSYDLSGIENVEIPSWIKWIADNGTNVALILGAIGAAIIGLKLSSFLANILGVTEGLVKFKAGIGLILAGAVMLIGEIINLVVNWDKLNNSQKAVAMGIAALGAALLGLGVYLATASGGLSLIIPLVVALATALGALIFKNKEDEKTTLNAAEATKQLKEAKDKLRESTNKYTNALENSRQTQKELERIQNKYNVSGEKLFSSILAGTKNVQDLEEWELELYKAYLNNESAQKELTEANKEMNEYRKESIDKAIQEAAAVYKETGQYNEYFNAVIDGYNKKNIQEATMLRTTAEIYSKLDEASKKTFAQNLPENIKKALESNSRITEVFGDVEVSLKEISNASKKTFGKEIPNNIQKSIDKISALTSKILGLSKNAAINISATVKSAAGSKNAKGAIYYPPKLASGGIINMPGRGVPLGAIGGERGAEGVIPLTDSQMMAQLGEAIGRNVVINTILNNYMNSRLISREQQKTTNIDNFAFNR